MVGKVILGLVGASFAQRGGGSKSHMGNQTPIIQKSYNDNQIRQQEQEREQLRKEIQKRNQEREQVRTETEKRKQ